jgi:uncharacterized protein YukJ
MPLPDTYGVLKARITDSRRGTAPSWHFNIHAEASGVSYRVAVNVLSEKTHPPQNLRARFIEPFQNPMTAKLEALSVAFHPLKGDPGGLALDFIRGGLTTRDQMQQVPPTSPDPNNLTDLDDRIGALVEEAKATAGAVVYFFGDSWKTSHKPDPIFHFHPDHGVHDIHMNQGSPRPASHVPGHRDFSDDNGPWQDGDMLFAFPDRWVAVLLAFNTQIWQTDDSTGFPLPGAHN